MLERYNTSEMSSLWASDKKYETWMDVELAVCYGWYKQGTIPFEAWENIQSDISFDPVRIEQLENVTRHDVAAFVQNLQENILEYGHYVHFGVTSSDILDTALALLMRESLKIIDVELQKLMNILEHYAVKFKSTISVGRTHGVHAEPTSFGLKFLLWMDDFSKHQEHLKQLSEEVSTGKISGVVGTYATIPPLVEKYALERLNLARAAISTQIIQRECHARFVSCLALLGCTIEKVAVELRHLQRTEVREAMESFSSGQKGSSAMPHKKNPVSSENLCGLSRVLRGFAVTAMEDVALWHERDISHSSAERIILPDSSGLLHYMLRRLCNILDDMSFYEDRMCDNLNITRGLLFSQRVLLAFIDKGLSREEAYSVVQKSALKVWNDESLNLRSELWRDESIQKLFGRDEFEALFDIGYYFTYIDDIYARFGL